MFLERARRRLEDILSRGKAATWDELYHKVWVNLPPESQSIGSEKPGTHFAKIAEYVSDLLQQSSEDWILDMGCDSGALSFHVCRKARKLVGVDFVEALVKTAARTNEDSSKSEFMVADCQYLPFKDNSFEKVCTYNLIHTVDKKEQGIRILQEAIRVTKPAGRIVVGSLPDRRKRKYWKKRKCPLVRIYDTLVLFVPKRVVKSLGLPIFPKWIWYDFAKL